MAIRITVQNLASLIESGKVTENDPNGTNPEYADPQAQSGSSPGNLWVVYATVAAGNGQRRVVAWRNSETGQIVAAGRDNYVLADAVDAFPDKPEKPKKPRPDRRPRPAGGTGGGATFTGGSGQQRVQELNAALAAGKPGITDPTGQLTVEAQRDLVDGLDATQVLALIPYLSQDATLLFTAWVQDDGTTIYIDAQLVTAGDVDTLQRTGINAMNFPTAYFYGLQGVPIGRLSTSGDGALPLVWYTYEAGIWYYNSATERKVVDVDVWTRSDLFATDWTTPGCLILDLPVRPGFPINAESVQPDGPTWDVRNPPCRVWDPAA